MDQKYGTNCFLGLSMVQSSNLMPTFASDHSILFFELGILGKISKKSQLLGFVPLFCQTKADRAETWQYPSGEGAQVVCQTWPRYALIKWAKRPNMVKNCDSRNPIFFTISCDVQPNLGSYKQHQCSVLADVLCYIMHTITLLGHRRQWWKISPEVCATDASSSKPVLENQFQLAVTEPNLNPSA